MASRAYGDDQDPAAGHRVLQRQFLRAELSGGLEHAQQNWPGVKEGQLNHHHALPAKTLMWVVAPELTAA